VVNQPGQEANHCRHEICEFFFSFLIHVRRTAIKDRNNFVGFEADTAVTTKNAVFWDEAPCGLIVNRRFGGACRLYLQSITISYISIFSNLTMEAIGSSETSVYNKPIGRHIPENGRKDETAGSAVVLCSVA
jgi:hypothetical protein